MKNDFKEIYKISKERTNRINIILTKFKEKEKIQFAEDFLVELGIEINNNNIFSAIERLVLLKEDGIINIFKSYNLKEDEIDNKLMKAYELTVEYQENENKHILELISNSNISFTTKAVIDILYKITVQTNKMYLKWFKDVVLYNKNFIKQFENESDAVKYLKEHNLYDYWNNKKYDCSYSALKGSLENGYKVITYGELFKDELETLNNNINLFLKFIKPEHTLSLHFKNYIEQFKDTINNKSIQNNINKWAELDKEWMNINTPLQCVHMMEYYEDTLRNSVSPDFDIRIDDPTKENNITGKIVFDMMLNYLNEKHNDEYKELTNIVFKNINKVQLHIGELLFYSGGELRGLMSAQVIPNNEEVSILKGKKIFAFMDKGYETIKNRPKMKLRYKIFPKNYIEIEDKFIENKEKWEEVYDITTIGHEFGHVLWKDEDTEIKMSQSNIFKNIEEFKASAGGIVSFFNSEREDNLWQEVFINTISRSIKLIAWKEVKEVEPYYCESIITLNILQKSGIIDFKDNEIKFNIRYINYLKFRELYKEEYFNLVEHYLNKKDAKEYLDKHAVVENNYYISKNNIVKDIQNHYFDLYRKIGNEIFE